MKESHIWNIKFSNVITISYEIMISCIFFIMKLFYMWLLCKWDHGWKLSHFSLPFIKIPLLFWLCEIIQSFLLGSTNSEILHVLAMQVMVPQWWLATNDSVWTRMTAVSPNCIRMTWICHSLSLCVRHAFEKLASNVGFLLAKVPKWFSKSTIRCEPYKEPFEVMSPDEQLCTPFQKFSKTRWFIRGKLLFRILSSWNELKPILK